MDNIKKLDYWAEELAIPLFIYSNPNNSHFRNNFLAFNQGKRIGFYFVNDRLDQLIDSGYEYFSQGGFTKYPQEVEAAKLKFEEFGQSFAKIKLNQLDDHVFIKFVYNYIDQINLVSEMVFKTEAPCLKKFESRQDELAAELKAVGESRLSLRSYAETLIYNIFDQVLAEIVRRKEVAMGDIMYYTYQELVGLLEQNQKVTPEEISNRQSGFVYGFADGNLIFLTRQDYINALDLIKEDQTGEITELRGFVASKGSAKGVVRKILHDKEIFLKTWQISKRAKFW